MRALVPLVPRPAVLPFDPSPRPTRVLASFELGAGFRSYSLMIARSLTSTSSTSTGGDHLSQSAGLRVVLHGPPTGGIFFGPASAGLSRCPARADDAAHLGDLELTRPWSCFPHALPLQPAWEASACSSAGHAACRPARPSSMEQTATGRFTSSGRCSSLSAVGGVHHVDRVVVAQRLVPGTSCTPAHSSTAARQAPLAMTPVPGAGGRSMTTPCRRPHPARDGSRCRRSAGTGRSSARLFRHLGDGGGNFGLLP